ncbi:hypothetical protein ACJMK2_044276 [Sinanodonta woodiana]|uniref:Uncharacterized protein n=1 Tax=Sinanodonta woodiana TaxID=1069815 RepID=A0ABD3VZL3_SINWO
MERGGIEMNLLDGTVKELPPLPSQIVRVFLSSTFSDMAEERNALLEHVYPKLKKYTKEKYGAEFQIVDMRWGVTNESQNDHMTSTVCLKEIRNCQRISIGPNFVALIGQKYGYRPIPAMIAAVEFEVLRSCLDIAGEDLHVLDKWYRKDDNALPAEYVLQPISSILNDYNSEDDTLKTNARTEWGDNFEKMRTLLKKAADSAFDEGKINAEVKEKYYISVTEDEIKLGMFECPESVNEKCLCFIRNIESLKDKIDHNRAGKFIDLSVSPLVNSGKPAELDTEAQDLLSYLRDKKIPEVLDKQNIVRLSTKWSEKDGINKDDNKEYIAEFMDSFFQKMCWLIDKNLSSIGNLHMNSLRHEVIESLKIRHDWNEVFYGRDDILKQVQGYICDKNNSMPLVLYGESGCGKTAIMAACSNQSQTWVKGQPATVVRFLGTTPSTSHILLALRSICKQISLLYDADPRNIPTEYPELIDHFKSLLELSTQDRPLILYLDALDQLSPSLEPHKLKWLPTTLPKNTKVVLSLVLNHYYTQQRLSSTFPKTKSNVIEVSQLGDKLSMQVLKDRLHTSGRTITNEQEQIVSDLFTSCSLPLFGRVVYDEISAWKSYMKIKVEKISSSVKEAIHEYYDRLEQQHGRTLVKHALSYLTASREGISEVELLDVLSLDDAALDSIFIYWLPPVRRIPPFLWTRLRMDLDKFLVRRGGDGSDVQVWYHKQFSEVAADRYLKEEDFRKEIHKNLAEYFLGEWSDGKKKSFRYSKYLKARLALKGDEGSEDRKVPAQPLVFKDVNNGENIVVYNRRKLSELPYHLTLCGLWDILRQTCIFSYKWLMTKLKCFGLQAVVEDLALANSFLHDEEIGAVEDALRIAGPALNLNPASLSLEITGRLLDFFDDKVSIRSLIHECDIDSKKDCAVIAPCQIFDPPISALSRSLEGHSADVAAGVLIRGGSEVVSISTDGNIKHWDISSGEVIKEIHLPHARVLSWNRIEVLVDRNESHVVCKSKRNIVNYDIISLDSFQVVFSNQSKILNSFHRLCMSGKFVCMDNAVFSIAEGKKIHDINEYRKLTKFVVVNISMDEKFLLLGMTGSVEMFDIETARKVKNLPTDNVASCIQLSKDGRLAIIGQSVDCKIRIFDMYRKAKTFGQQIVEYDSKVAFPDAEFFEDNYDTEEVSEISISNNGKSFVSLIKGKYAIVWSLENVSRKPLFLSLPIIEGPVTYYFSMFFSSDDRYILAAGLSPKISVLEAASGKLLSSFAAHQNDLHELLVSRHSNMVISIAHGDPTMKQWDMEQIVKMGQMSTMRNPSVSAHSIAFSKQDNIVFICRVYPRKSQKAYHFIDYFGIDILDLSKGTPRELIPFDRYGPFRSLTVSKDSSIMVIMTGMESSGNIHVIDTRRGKLLDSITVSECKNVKISPDGQFLAIFRKDANEIRHLQDHPRVNKLETFSSCVRGMFSKKSTFIGVTTKNELIVHEANEDVSESAPLKIPLQGSVKSIHYSDATDIVLITQEDGEETFCTAYKTEGFGLLGTLYGVSEGGIQDVASDGSICIDSDLQIFELERFKIIKRLYHERGVKSSNIRSVRLSMKGEHAVWIDTKPLDCVKVCRIKDSEIIATCCLHTVPDVIEVLTPFNTIVVIGRDRNLYLLSLIETSRKFIGSASSKGERLSMILDYMESEEEEDTQRGKEIKIPKSVRDKMKIINKRQQVKTLTLTKKDSVENHLQSQSTTLQRKDSLMCIVV